MMDGRLRMKVEVSTCRTIPLSILTLLLLAWVPALAEEEDPIRVFFDGGTGIGYRFTDPPGKDLGCKFGANFNIDIDIYYFLGIPDTKDVDLVVESGDGANEPSYNGNTVPGVSFSPSPTVTVPRTPLADLPLDPSDPHVDVTVTIPLTGLSPGTHYYRVHAQAVGPGGAHNLYFFFETDCVPTVPEFSNPSIAMLLGSLTTAVILIYSRKGLSVKIR